GLLHQQLARWTTCLLSEDQPYGDKRDDEAGKNSDDERLQFCMIMQRSAADGFAPDSREAKEHGFRISNSGNGSDDSAEQGEDGRFDQKDRPNLFGTKSSASELAARACAR